ncbi:MAG TPA: hypothetical protein VG753_02975 [Candidatus Paceibacterota bacterium]|nr:hypothetical protein [Candidatus Paceibacterota bacterium]
MTRKATYEEMVEAAARQRGDMEVPRPFIIEAIDRIKQGLEQSEHYPSGQPTLIGIYKVAVQLQGRASVAH